MKISPKTFKFTYFNDTKAVEIYPIKLKGPII